MNPKSHSLPAFTLIELLVVISIMGILAALLFPAMGKIQDNANGTKCASNLKQIGAVMLAYAGEHNGCFPMSSENEITYSGTDQVTGQPAWTKQLEKYLGTFVTANASDVRIFTCPSTAKLLKNTSPFGYFNGSRAAAYDSASASPKFTNAGAVRQTLIQYPSKYILAGDVVCNTMSATNADKNNYLQDPAFDPTNCARNLPKIHNGKANILFADGHVAGFSTFDYSKPAGTAKNDSDSRSMTVWYDQVADYNGKQ